MVIVKVVLGLVLAFCYTCGRWTWKYIHKSDRLYEDHQCSECNVITPGRG
jgi:hypothetical protein